MPVQSSPCSQGAVAATAESQAAGGFPARGQRAGRAAWEAEHTAESASRLPCLGTGARTLGSELRSTGLGCCRRASVLRWEHLYCYLHFSAVFSLLPVFWFFPVTKEKVLPEFSSAFSDDNRPVQPKLVPDEMEQSGGGRLQTPLLISLVSAGEQQFYVEFAVFPLPSVIWRIPVMFPGRVVFTVRAPHNQRIEES